MQFYLKKLPNNCLAPEDSAALESLQKLKVGEVVRAEVKRPRNYKFHQKLFSLLDYAFDCWEPNEDIGAKNKEEFRKNVTILAGHYESIVALDGTRHLRAKSISFASMDEDSFAEFYNKVVGVLLKWVLKNYTREDVENVMNEIAEYA